MIRYLRKHLGSIRTPYLLLIVFPILTAFYWHQGLENEKNFILHLLKEDSSSVVHEVINNPEKYRLQIVYSEILRNDKRGLHLRTHTFRTQSDEYFYPASMAKLPVAALTLEKLHELHLEKYPADQLLIQTSSKGNTIPPPTTIEDKIKKLFVVSNNAVFNDLYDFLGQEYINRRLWEMGYKEDRIIQKFMSLDTLGHRTSLPVKLLTKDGQVVYERDTIVSPFRMKNNAYKNQVGKGYYDERKVIYKPKDFSTSNYLPLEDLHQMLVSIIYPELVTEEKRFRLDECDYDLLKKYMSMLPREAGEPEWMDTTVYYDSFRKYIMMGNTRSRIDSSLRIFNKVGQAYGFMTDCAYIRDEAKNIEFFISATIYVNKNEIINDGKYEYNTIGFPFLERLGKDLYDYELRKKDKLLIHKK